jgi:hypothetical protein
LNSQLVKAPRSSGIPTQLPDYPIPQFRNVYSRCQAKMNMAGEPTTVDDRVAKRVNQPAEAATDWRCCTGMKISGIAAAGALL